MYENIPVQTKMAILSRRLLAILLYEQFLHLTKINLHPNTQLWSTQQHAHQSILVTSLFHSVCVTVAFWVNFKEKHFFINMNISSLTIMYDSIFAQMYIFLIEKYFLQFWLKAKFVNNTRNTYILAKMLSYIVVG